MAFAMTAIITLPSAYKLIYDYSDLYGTIESFERHSDFDFTFDIWCFEIFLLVYVMAAELVKVWPWTDLESYTSRGHIKHDK